MSPAALEKDASSTAVVPSWERPKLESLSGKQAWREATLGGLCDPLVCSNIFLQKVPFQDITLVSIGVLYGWNFFQKRFFYFSFLLIRGHCVAPHISYFLRRAPLVISLRSFCLLYLSRRYLAMAQIPLSFKERRSLRLYVSTSRLGIGGPSANGAELHELAGAARRRSFPSGRADRQRLILRHLESMWHTSLGKGGINSREFWQHRRAAQFITTQLMNGSRKTNKRGAFLATEYYGTVNVLSCYGIL